MRSTLITAVLALALLALSAGPAAARPDVSSNRIDAANHATAMRSLASFKQQIAADLERVTSPAPTAAARTVRIVRVPVTDNGFNWLDGAIGAGLTAALLLTGAGLASARRHPSATTRQAS